MLSDTILESAGKLGGVIVRTVGAGLRGALLFGLLACGVGLFLAAAPALGAAFGAVSLGAGLGMAAAALTSASALAAGLAWAGAGAVGGAVMLAVASFIPGPEEMAQKAAADTHAKNVAIAEAAQAQAMDNPYYQPGLGARLAERGNAIQQARINA